MQRFTDLEVWKRGHRFLLAVYEVAKRLPEEERYGMGPQFRTAAVSVTSNIAEGSRRAQPADYARFLNYSQASLSELENLFMAARDLGYLHQDRAARLIDEAQQIGRMIFRLREKVLRYAISSPAPPAPSRAPRAEER